MKINKESFSDGVILLLICIINCLKYSPVFMGILYGLHIIGVSGISFTILYVLLSILYFLLCGFNYFLNYLFDYRIEQKKNRKNSEEVANFSDVEEKRS